ncbi:MAG: tetratricopeptide repeat protein [Endomicrobiia bacterium]|nr:tetratricopeptide repeat protein [Endomicrobiia bacterium]
MTRTERFLIYLMLIVSPLVFFTDLTRNPYHFQIVFLNAATVALWMLFLWRSLKAGKIVIKTGVSALPILVFFAFATFTWLFNLGANWGDDFLRYSSYSEGLKRWLFTLTNVVLVYYIPLNFFDPGPINVKEDAARRMRVILFSVGFVAAVYGIMQFLGFEAIWATALNPFGGRSVSTFGNPNFLSSFLVVLLPMALARYLAADDTPTVWAYFVCVFAYAISLTVTLTRSSWAGAAAGLVVFFLLGRGMSALAARSTRKRLAVLGGAVILAVMLWPHPKSADKYVPAVYERFAEIKGAGRGVYGPLHQRFLIWSCAWQMTSENPVIGRGWGLFELFYPYYQGKYLFVKAYKDLRTHANNSHNEILEIISQTGIVGFGIYIWMLAVIIISGISAARASADGSRRLMNAAMLGGVVGMLVDNLMNVSLHFAVPAFLYWWVVGSLSAESGFRTIELDINGRFRRAAVVVGMAAGALIIARYYMSFMGEINYFAGFKLSKRGDVAGALPYLERAHRWQRFEVNNNYELANTYARLGRREDALKAYREALRANAGYDEIFFNMATVYNQMGRRDEAIANYSRALAINPLSQDAYAALGSIYFADLRGDNIRAAARLFERASMFFAGSTDILNNLGYLYTRMGEPRKAASYYIEALNIDPDFAVARRNLENISRASGIKIPPDDFEAGLKRIESLTASGRQDEALKLALELTSRHPGSFRGKFYLANVYFMKGDFFEAAGLYEGLVAARPDNVSLRTNLAFAYEKLGRVSAASAQFREILRREPSNSLAAQKLAVSGHGQAGR